MAAYDVTKIWDVGAAQIFEGAGNGTDIGFTGEVAIAQERTTHDVTASQTGGTVLDRRLTDLRYKLTIDFKEVGEANWFENWWFQGHPNSGTDLHPGAVGASLPTKRLRIHPRNMGADLTRDFVFDTVVLDGGPTMTLNGNNEHVHRFTLIALPDPTQLPTLHVGTLGWALV